jgi:uncharacterized membrane protein
MTMNPKQVISLCVEEFEAKTQVELVVLIRRCASSYYSFFWFYTLLFTQILWISTVLWNESFEFELLALESLFLIALSYVLLIRFELIRFLVPKKTKLKNLKDFAAKEFFNLGIFNTKRRSGLLVIYSRWENECLLICDKGVKEKVTDKEIEAFTGDFKNAFAAKDLSESVGSAIRSFGVFWHAKWPNEDDENEIVHSFSGEHE